MTRKMVICVVSAIGELVEKGDSLAAAEKENASEEAFFCNKKA